MELKIKQLTLPEVITFNYDELKGMIEQKSAEYAAMVYSDEQIREAKTDRANLNHLKKALNDERIRLEREYMQPFNDFKTKIAELISIIDKPISSIDSNIKAFEEKQKAEKLEAIKEAFTAIQSIFIDVDWLTLDAIMNPKWLNASFKLSAIQQEIEDRLKQIVNDLTTLSNLPEFAFEAVEVYKHTLDMNKAISEGHRLAEMQKRKAEAEAAAKAKANEAPRVMAVDLAEHPDSTVTVQPVATAKKERIEFWAMLTPADARALRDFFQSRNIEFGTI